MRMRFNLNLFDKKKGYLLFLRHGKTDWNIQRKMQGRDDIPLNEEGLREALFAALGFASACKRGLKIDRIITSPLSRASKTGEIIARATNSTYTTDFRLMERDFGALSGTQYSPNSKAITEDVTIEGLESIASVIERINSFIRDNVKIGETTVAVSHGSATKIFALQAKKDPSVTNYNELLGNCCMIIYSYDGNEVLMEGYNISPSHLKDLI